jgi:OOP family OmpA-OmpF porin
MLFNAFDQRAYVRVEARDILFQDRGQEGFSHHMGLTAGLQWNMFGKVRDQDLDRVRDWNDKCPDTPIGASVDASGCPNDPDGDGVWDGVDKCPNTPKGCTVDKTGCPSDADGDGVCDGVDTCAATPAGATVDAFGCPADPDSDGVYTGADQCENTPKGCTVSATGCPSDSDADGVCDGVDVCPNTPAGLKVDAHGCPIEVSEMEVQLLDTGMIRLENIQFETKKAQLKPESVTRVEEAARVLQQYPDLRIEIGGHADNRGSKKLNDTLSTSRANAVFEYVKANFPKVPADQYSAKGYGFSKPIAPNTTDAGRARNRRVEFKVLNTGALRIERDKRRFLRTGESAPAAPARTDTTQAPAPSPAPADTTRR